MAGDDPSQAPKKLNKQYCLCSVSHSELEMTKRIVAA